MPSRTFRALYRIFSKPDNAKNIENKPGRTFVALNSFFFIMWPDFFFFRKKVMALIMTY